jgi:3-dehydroquinate synthase
VEIRVAGSYYPALVRCGLIGELGRYVSKYLSHDTCALITDKTVAPLFARRVKESLVTAEFHPTLIAISAGEKSKTLQQAGTICDQMIAAGLDRHSFVIGLGGGMIGDISGFVAAVYERGIPHVQIPTTLLAMVDSSIGGKTGVNTRDGKNLIGAFHHPSLVIDDIDVLKTLPRREFNQGFAEIIKHAVIADPKMFRALQVARASGLRRASGTHVLLSIIKRNIEIKSKIVAKDERDQSGHRAILNFGHTVGHAIERAGGYRTFLHGEAVSLGMVAACTISTKKSALPPGQRDGIVDLLKKFDLPTRLPPNFRRKKILDALKFDKKFEGGNVRFVVTPRIGVAHVSEDVTFDDICEAVEQL